MDPRIDPSWLRIKVVHEGYTLDKIAHYVCDSRKYVPRVQRKRKVRREINISLQCVMLCL